jgi:Putative Ig domain
MYRPSLVLYSLISIAVSMAGCVGSSRSTSEVSSIISASPSSVVAGSNSTKVMIFGVNLSANTAVLVNGSARATTYVNASQLASILTSKDLAEPRTLQISFADSAGNALASQSTTIGSLKNFLDFTVTPAQLNILTSSVPAAVVQAPYSAVLEAQGGVQPYTWTVASGQLPRGLSLGASTGVISGIPMQTEKSSLTVQVATSSSSAIVTRQISLSVLPTSPSAPTGSPSPSQSEPAHVPELPRAYIDTSMPRQTGLTIAVLAGGDFQGALNNATCGDTVELAEGAMFTGNFVLPVKSCDGWVVVRTSAPDSSIPPAGSRITPGYSQVLSKIASPNSAPAVSAQFGAHHFRFVALEITTTMSSEDSVQYGLLNWGTDPSGESATSASQLPHHIVIDRCYIHGTPEGNVKRGIEFDGAFLAVVDSYISDIHVIGQDAQAIAGWNGPGPFKIVNNELEAAGENVMFGGAQPTLLNNIPSDIEIRGNHFFKPLSWMVGNPSYAGNHWSVKNLLELKIAQRVLITGNILENNWVDGQTGFAFLISPRTELGNAPWIYTQDITFTYNVVRHTASGINIMGIDDGDPQKMVRGKRILIQNNLFSDINGKAWGDGDGWLFQVISGADAVTIDHNTGFQTNQIITADGAPNTNFVYQNNIAPHNMYGVKGSGYASGTPSLNYYFPGFVFQKNVIENTASSGVSQSSYPPGNFFTQDWAAVKFVNIANGNYALAPGSPYKNAGTDSKDIGADVAGLNAATSSVIVN